MSRTARPPAVLVTAALIGAIGAGCGSQASSTTAAAGGSGGGGGSGLTTRAKAVKFAECIRSHGVGDFPDPDAKNDFQYGVSVTPAVWKRATTACKNLQPPGTLSSRRTPQQQSAALRFAQCMRANGVKDFPDPVKGQPLINTYRIPSSNQPGGMTILNAGIAKCRSLLQTAAAAQ